MIFSLYLADSQGVKTFKSNSLPKSLLARQPMQVFFLFLHSQLYFWLVKSLFLPNFPKYSVSRSPKTASFYFIVR